MLKTSVVLTLAGVAGIILSIGMAVDANILIFERVKEELRAGKPLKTAIDTGFIRAWSAIRDSNFSTLLTCGILFYFGSSIIRGFAFNLAAGILVSMFTAITITRTLLLGFVGGRLAKNVKLFGGSEKKKERNFTFIKYSKIWLGISGTLVVVSIVSMFAFGLNLGIDFTGGTLLEFQFNETMNKEELATTLNEIGKELEATPAESTATPEASDVNEIALSSTVDSSSVDLEHIQILNSGENGFIVKTKYMSSEAHTEILKLMKEKLPEFTEPRFTTIGPTIGATLLSKAMTAIIFTLIMIIIYIGIAFRKITKELSSWKFGATAIAALAHDVIIVTGLFVILSQFFNVEIDALFITAMLTVFGYSVNDTIVVYDRLRENMLASKGEDIETITDKAMNQTMARSINTSLSTVITLIAVLILGSNAIFFFILALTAGTIIGTYSSIFTASPLLVAWEKWQNRK
jgi:SecD/SecF fusion protein